MSVNADWGISELEAQAGHNLCSCGRREPLLTPHLQPASTFPISSAIFEPPKAISTN